MQFGERSFDAYFKKFFVKYLPLFSNLGVLFPNLLHSYYRIVFNTTPLEMSNIGQTRPVLPNIIQMTHRAIMELLFSLPYILVPALGTSDTVNKVVRFARHMLFDNEYLSGCCDVDG